METLRSIALEGQCAVLVVTPHDNRICRFADRIVRMSDGRIEAEELAPNGASTMTSPIRLRCGLPTSAAGLLGFACARVLETRASRGVSAALLYPEINPVSEETRKGLAVLVENEQDKLALADERYRGGLTAFVDVLEAQRSLQESQISLARAHGEVGRTFVALNKSLGH